MTASRKVWWVGLAACLVLGVVQAAHGQFVYRTPRGAVVVPRTTQAWVRPAVVPRSAYFGYRPYWRSYYYPYWNNPYGYYAAQSYLSGLSSVYNAQGQYQMAQAQANILQQRAKQANLETQRKIFDEMMYERSLRPTREDVREQQKFNELRRALNTPTDTDIWSGRTLNTLMSAIARTEAQTGAHGPNVPLDEDIVKRLNVTTGTSNGSISLVTGPLHWPLSLQVSEFDKARQAIDANLPAAVAVIRDGGSSDNSALRKVLENIKALRVLLDDEIDSLTPNQYITANRYLNQLSDAVHMLEMSGAQNYLVGKWAASGNTVDQLVYNMGQKGLRFAPAVPGDEAAYNVAYQALRQYELGLGKVAGGPEGRR